MLDAELIKNILIKQKILPKEDFEKAVKRARDEKINLTDYLVKNNLVSENILYESVARELKIPFIDLRNQMLRRDILELVPEQIVQAHQVVCFEKNASEIKLACLDPQDLQTFEFIEKKVGLTPIIYLTTPESIKQVLKQYHIGLKAEFREITKVSLEKGMVGGPSDLKKLAQDLPVVRIVDTILEYAIFENASDIHIEPTEKDTVVRYRVDGILREVMSLPRSIHTGVAARVKILSNLKIDEHRLPQDGRFKVSTADYKVAFRVSIIPVFDGEKIELRLLNESAQVLSLKQIGLQKIALDILERNIKKPHGIILVTGPTGSGKTTTLYSILNVLNTHKVNISTIEDPIEYRIPGVNQSQVSTKIGYTFATGLRAFLRQDPNIIMVGEIRDNETAEIATHAAMTGHLVLSTLHTNDAVTALPRLREMGVPSFLVASTTNIVMAQRLVRKICQNCIESYTLTTKNIEELEKQLNFRSILETLEKIGTIASAKQSLDTLLFYRGRGCKQCNMEGYKGRMGIYEIMEITPKISELIINNAPTELLQKTATEEGMLRMIQDGFIKAKTGVTTIEEVLRVTKE